MEQPLIEFNNVFKKFGETPVLNGVDLSIYEGETTTIIGKSGVGKSVLLKHIVGLLEHDEGHILFKGNPVSQMSAKDKKAFKQMFSYMFQGTALFDSMTVMQNISLPLEQSRRLARKKIREKVREKMKQLDIADIENKYPSQLSGGMKKRVALARALITDPEIVLFDEPTTGLDPIRKSTVHSMIADYQKKFGFTAVMVSHEIPDIFFISQKIAMLEDGRILFQGTPEEFQNVDEPVIQQFIHGLQSRHDDLTGLVHKTQAEAHFQEAMARFDRYMVPFSIILLTVENLSELDTKLGHQASHAALKNLAVQVRRHFRISDSCSRYGMNQIMVLLSGTDIGNAKIICERFVQDMEFENGVEIKPYPEFCFSVTAGIVQVRQGEQLNTAVANAELSKSIVYEFNVC